MELIGHYAKPVERQVCEGVYIHSDPSDLVMNDKLDHHLPAVARVTYSNAAADRGEGEEGVQGEEEGEEVEEGGEGEAGEVAPRPQGRARGDGEQEPMISS